MAARKESTKLKKRERDILGHLIAECEATIEAARALAAMGKVDNPETNLPFSRELGLKAGAILSAVGTSGNAGLFRQVDLTDGMERKREQLAKFHKAPAWQEPA